MTTIPQKIASMIDLNVPETHLDVDLEQPKRKENNPFPADKIRSSLSRNMSFKSTAEVAPKLERIVPKVEGNLAEVAVPKAEVKPEPNTDMTTAKSQIKTLLKENDCLLLENEKQQEEMQELEMKISSLSRQLLTVNQELKESQDQQILIQDQLFQFKNSSKDMERILQKEAHVVASKDADIEQLSELLRKRQYEIKQNLDKQEQLKKALSDLSERYKEIVRESSYATQREKHLLKEVEEKDQVIDQLKELMEEKKKSYILIEEESEKLKAINKGLERKVQLLERKELEYISKNQQQSHDLEEALFERDVATKREQSLLKEIETLTQQCLDQPRIYSEKHTLAMQTLQSQFNVERRTFCDEVGKLEVLVASLQSQIDRAIREKRAAESELDKITAHLPAETNRLEMALEEAHSKLRQSERDKHEAIQKLDSVYNKLQKEQHQYDAERRQANDRMEESYRRVRRMEIQVNESKVISFD
jgi:chromosome segregation ATPase